MSRYPEGESCSQRRSGHCYQRPFCLELAARAAKVTGALATLGWLSARKDYKALEEAIEKLGPTYVKFGQALASRWGLVDSARPVIQSHDAIGARQTLLAPSLPAWQILLAPSLATWQILLAPS